jgi:hypothetical protein
MRYFTRDSPAKEVDTSHGFRRVGSKTRKETSMATKPRRNGSKELQAIEASGGEERAEGAGGNSALDEEIRRRAYQLYVERGEEHGRDLDDWLQAKREFEIGALWPEQAN